VVSGSSLQGKFLRIIVVAYLAVSAATLFVFFGSLDGIARRLGTDFAVQYVLKEKAVISAPINREIALARKLADTPLIKKWTLAENSAELRKDALTELESFKNHFQDGSWFFVVHSSGHYYFNDKAGTYTGKELRYTLDSSDPADAWYFSTVTQVQDFALNVNYDKDIKQTKLWINVLVRDGHTVLGLAGTGLTLDAFIRDFIAGKPVGIVPVLLDAAGAIQAHPDPLHIDQSSISKKPEDRSTLAKLLLDEKDRTALKDALKRLASGNTQVEAIWVRTAEGERICSLVRIPEIDWYAAVLFEHDRIIGLSRFLPMITTSVLSLLLLSTLLLLALRRVILKPIVELTRSTQDFSEGKPTTPLPVRSSDELGVLTEAFNSMTSTIRNYTESLEATVRRRTEDLRTLLDNTGEGILSFGTDFLVDNDYSRECAGLLGAEPAGKRIDTLLHPADEAASALFRRALERAFTTDDTYKQELFLSLIPTELTLGDRHISLRFKNLESGRMMAILNDISRKKELEAKVSREQKKVSFIVSALTNRHLFHEVADAFSHFTSKEAPALLEDPDVHASIMELYRQLHTFKGLFLQLDLAATPAALHRCEERLATLRTEVEVATPADGTLRSRLHEAVDLGSLNTAFAADEEILRRYLGATFLAREEPWTIAAADIDTLERLSENLNALPKSERDIDLESGLAVIRRLRTVPLFDLLDSFPAHTLELAELRGKRIKPFAIQGRNVRVRRDRYAGFALSLVHLFRNAVVHGIEAPEVRLRKGKAEEGTVGFSTDYVDGVLSFSMSDDGAGIDMEAVQKIARARGLNSYLNAGKLEPDDVAAILFRVGLTTKENADLYGGRGIGLSAVGAETDRLGGSIQVQTSPGSGTRIIIRIPDTEVFS